MEDTQDEVNKFAFDEDFSNRIMLKAVLEDIDAVVSRLGCERRCG